MSDFPRGYQMWADYSDESPDDLANRLRAEHIDTITNLADRLDRIADALDTIANTLKENK